MLPHYLYTNLEIPRKVNTLSPLIDGFLPASKLVQLIGLEVVAP